MNKRKRNETENFKLNNKNYEINKAKNNLKQFGTKVASFANLHKLMTRLVSVPIYQQCNRVHLQTINNQFNEVDVNETINNQFNEVDANVTVPIYSNETINNQFNDVDVNARCHNKKISTYKPLTSIFFNSLTFVPCL